MYDEYISSDKFHAYRGTLSKIYQGEDVDYSIEEIEDSIHKDYETGSLSSYFVKPETIDFWAFPHINSY